jgi:hypothetical protein
MAKKGATRTTALIARDLQQVGCRLTHGDDHGFKHEFAALFGVES